MFFYQSSKNNKMTIKDHQDYIYLKALFKANYPGFNVLSITPFIAGNWQPEEDTNIIYYGRVKGQAQVYLKRNETDEPMQYTTTISLFYNPNAGGGAGEIQSRNNNAEYFALFNIASDIVDIVGWRIVIE